MNAADFSGGVEWCDYVRNRARLNPPLCSSPAYGRVKSWMAGCRPPAKAGKIRRCAADLGATEYDIIAILWPGIRNADDVEYWHYRCRRDKANADRKAKPGYAESVRARSRDPRTKERMRKWLRARSKFQGDTAAFHAHQRATLIANMAKAMAAQGKRPPGSPQGKALAQIKSARSRLRQINQSLNRIDRELKRNYKYAVELRRRALLPWRLAGFISEDKWVAETDEGKEWQRLRWQTRSHARDAKTRSLPGSFSTPDWRALMVTHGYHCAYCGRHRAEFRDKATRADLEMDHIYPIGHPWARNDESNIVPACKTCNTSKSDRDLLAWAKDKGMAIHPWAMQKYWAIHAAHQEPACQA